MIRWLLERLKGDKVIWLVVTLISLIGLLAVYSSTSAIAFQKKGGNTEYYMIKHLILLVMSFGVMYFVHLIDYRVFARLSKALLYITIPVLAMTLLFGPSINSASRWFFIFGQSFQPSDLAKLALMVHLARLLTEKQDVIKDFNQGFLPIIGWVAVICGLIAPANLSTASLIFLASVIMMFIAGVHIKYFLSILGIGLVAVFILFKTMPRAATWERRLSDYAARYTNPEYEPNYQTIQANIAISTGGVFGKGVGKSQQKNFLPHPYSDFVFAIILEEYGLFGGLLVLILYLILLMRGIAIVSVSKTFGAFLAAGLTFMLVMQAFINMGVTVGLFPVTGLPLPMLSMGGTSLLFTGMTLGIILSVSRHAVEEAKLAV